LSLATSLVFCTELICAAGAPRCSRFGRSACRAAVVARSVKLVHECIESGEADRCARPSPPVLIRVHRARHDSAGPGVAACQNLSLARCLVDHTMVHLRQPLRGGSHYHSDSPWPQRMKLPIGVRPCSHSKRERPDANDRSAWNSSPPLSTRVCPARRAKSPDGPCQARCCPRP
jgi:hypothetical protein